MSQIVRVLIVDDYPVVRQALQALLATAPDMTVVGETGDRFTAVRLAAELQPDIIIMDLLLPRLQGIELIRLISQENPHIRILVLTNHADPSFVRAALKAGAVGYFLKDPILTNVIEAIRHVFSGRLALHPLLSELLLAGLIDKDNEATALPADSILTNRELSVIQLVATGLGNQSIARQLNIEESTVRLHISHALRKLKLKNRTQLMLYALRQGLASLHYE